jgi:ribosome-binding protein aMBF1 (putative translation factor)
MCHRAKNRKKFREDVQNELDASLLSYRDLADRLNLSEARVARVISGHEKLTEKLVNDISSYLGLEVIIDDIVSDIPSCKGASASAKFNGNPFQVRLTKAINFKVISINLLADKLGTNQSTVRRWLEGSTYPRSDIFCSAIIHASLDPSVLIPEMHKWINSKDKPLPGWD